MSNSAELVREAKAVLPPLDLLEARLRQDPSALAPPRLRERAIIVDGAAPTPAPATPQDIEAARVLEHGQRAIEKVNREGERAALSDEERLGLEAIILQVGRPALLVLAGRFAPAPQGWEVLETFRNGIEANIASVGRIELKGGSMVGSAFVVGDNLVMTNRHVVKTIADQGPTGKWSFISGGNPQIDYLEEKDAAGAAEFRLLEVVAVSERPEVDLALIRVSPEPEGTTPTGWRAPTPLTVASDPPDTSAPERNVYVVGYPATDNEGLTAPEVLRRIFSNVFEVKRLQPGHLRTIFDDTPVFTHDCSTLGGNSGSCVIDLETNRVIGLHFKGSYRKANYAVALWNLTADRALRDAGVNFD